MNRYAKLCSHSVAVAHQEKLLPALIKYVRISYRSAVTYPRDNSGVGRKGGRKRQSRIFISRPEEVNTNQSSGSPFNQVWHNNEPLVVTYTTAVPKEKNLCKYCGNEFPRGQLSIVPFDVVLSHQERWEYRNPSKCSKEPKYLKSPPGKYTTNFYCIKKECVSNRFPYFRSDLLKIHNAVSLKEGHKVLLEEQLGVIV